MYKCMRNDLKTSFIHWWLRYSWNCNPMNAADLTNEKSTQIQVMAWCGQAPSHYQSQCWPRSMWLYGITGSQCVKHCLESYKNKTCIYSILWAQLSHAHRCLLRYYVNSAFKGNSMSQSIKVNFSQYKEFIAKPAAWWSHPVEPCWWASPPEAEPWSAVSWS